MSDTDTGTVCWRCKALGSTTLGRGVYNPRQRSVGTFTVTNPAGRVRRESLCADHLRGYSSAGWRVEA